jgi:hypothetical protein
VTNNSEVSPEENTSNGRVDYAFKLNNVSQFYIEAKSLKADLNREDYIKQSVSYSYARGVTWAILTVRFLALCGTRYHQNDSECYDVLPVFLFSCCIACIRCRRGG